MKTLVALFLLILSIASPAAAGDWKLIGEKQGITVYRRDLPGTGLVMFKGEGAIAAAPWKIASILLDTRRASEWVESLVESRVVRRIGPFSYVEYNHVGMPFILKDRDFVSEVSINVDGAKRAFELVYKPSAEPSAPVTRYVRGEIRSGTFDVQPLDQGERSTLTAEIQCDPKGAIPVWVSNFFEKSWPVKTFEGLRSQASKPDIRIPEEFKDVLAPLTH